jgi:hypothetical protein
MASEMTTKRFLIYSAGKAAAEDAAVIQNLAFKPVQELGVTAQSLGDYSLIQGEPCVAVEVTDTPDAIQALRGAWELSGLRIEEADREVHKLGDLSS